MTFNNSPKKNADRELTGKIGEALVAHSLEQQGFKILERNYRKFYGEIDIIAVKKDLLVFVEVRSRTHQFEDSLKILPSKQKKIVLVARAFLAKHKYDDNKTCRFDVAFVHGAGVDRTVTYIPNAFTSSGGDW
jgi:putative endonuclease